MFQSINATNFLSWENLQFDVTSGVTLIEGWNYDDETPEGSGKSAIPNALVWCLYGKLPKDAKIDDVIREGQKSCQVTVVLSDGTQVVRKRKPNDLHLIDPANPKEKIKGKDAKETQAWIETLLGFSFETFCQSVYFAQNYPKKFVTGTEEEKGKILSELQDLSIFDRARKKAHNLLKEEIASLTDLERQESHLEEMITSVTNNINDLEEAKETIKKQQDLKVERLLEEVSNTRSEKKKLDSQVKKLTKDTEEAATVMKEADAASKTVFKELVDLKSLLANVEHSCTLKSRGERAISSLEKKLEVTDAEREKLSSENPKCPTCGSSLKDKKEVILARLEELGKKSHEDYIELNRLVLECDSIKILDSKELTTLIDKKDSELEEIADMRNRALEVSGYLKEKQYSLREVESRIQGLDKELVEQKKINTTNVDEKIKKLRKNNADNRIKLNQARIAYKKSMKKSQQLEILKDSFKEVKSYIFQTVLLELTRRSNNYLSTLFNQDVKIKFDNLSETGEISKIVASATIDGISRPLGLYSGGQFRRIQLAVDLALFEIVGFRSGRQVNLRIFDEYMKDLSENSMENVLLLLEGLKGSTILIEHNSLFKSIVNNTVKVELRDGVSYMVGSDYAFETLQMPNMSNGS